VKIQTNRLDPANLTGPVAFSTATTRHYVTMTLIESEGLLRSLEGEREQDGSTL
jgi:hypothetical protein